MGRWLVQLDFQDKIQALLEFQHKFLVQLDFQDDLILFMSPICVHTSMHADASSAGDTMRIVHRLVALPCLFLSCHTNV